MAPVSVTLNDLERHFTCLKVFQIAYLKKLSVQYKTFYA